MKKFWDEMDERESGMGCFYITLGFIAAVIGGVIYICV
jgi:hypothetical protein